MLPRTLARTSVIIGLCDGTKDSTSSGRSGSLRFDTSMLAVVPTTEESGQELTHALQQTSPER